VWAVDLRTGKPVAEAPVAIYDENGAIIAKGQTGPDGVFETPVAPIKDPYSVSYAITAKPGEDTSAWRFPVGIQGIEASAFGVPTDYSQPLEKDYIYTDRPIYRPGQTLYSK